ncbi:MAG: hypothetical protein QOJ10_546, partial [Chloroflexota bacterium]|nr:hypothetical protein [Chloroflexota bacterium]
MNYSMDDENAAQIWANAQDKIVRHNSWR